MHLSLGFVLSQQNPLLSLAGSVAPAAAATMHRGGSSLAPLSRSLIRRRRGGVGAGGPFARQLARQLERSRLFCATTSQQQHQPNLQQQQQEEMEQKQITGIDLLDSAEPLVHSNPEIQVLLDRYRRLCEKHVPETMEEEVFDRNDIRSPLRAVFSNNLVDLSRVEVVGFDYDYTLATCELFTQHFL